MKSVQLQLGAQTAEGSGTQAKDSPDLNVSMTLYAFCMDQPAPQPVAALWGIPDRVCRRRRPSTAKPDHDREVEGEEDEAPATSPSSCHGNLWPGPRCCSPVAWARGASELHHEQLEACTGVHHGAISCRRQPAARRGRSCRSYSSFQSKDPFVQQQVMTTTTQHTSPTSVSPPVSPATTHHRARRRDHNTPVPPRPPARAAPPRLPPRSSLI